MQMVLNMVACIRSTREPTQLIYPFLLFDCVSSEPALHIKQKLHHDQRHEMTNDHIRRNERVRFYHVQKSKKGVEERGLALRGLI
jgi:hypothetical protein